MDPMRAVHRPHSVPLAGVFTARGSKKKVYVVASPQIIGYFPGHDKNVKANLMIPKQPLNAGKMRLRSGIKTPSAEKPLEPVPPPSASATPTPKPKSQPTSAKRDPSPRKRKAEPVEEEKVNGDSKSENAEEQSEDEMAELEGALSAGEDDDESEPDDVENGHDDEDDSNDDQEDGDDVSDEEDQSEDEDDEVHSDDNDDESSGTIPSLKPGQVPGLDPDDFDKGDEDLRNYRVETDANGNEKYVYDEIDPVYDSDDTDANEPANTIGDIDLKFYDSYPHIGYDINGKKIMRPAAGDALDALLDSIEVPKGWTGLTDPATGKPLNLSQKELELIKKIQMNELQDGFDPYPVCFLSLRMFTPTLLIPHRILSNGLPVMRRSCL